MAAGNRKSPTRAKSSESQYSITEFTDRFPNDDACLGYLWRTRYAPDGEHAPCPSAKCGGAEQTFRKYDGKQQRQAWTCVACGQYLYPTAGTIFHKSSTSLHLWFYAMYIMASTRCGVSAKQLERELGVTYKTAWRMFNKIRNQLMVEDREMPMNGKVEMDEMFVGGKPRQSDKAEWARKAEAAGTQGARYSEAQKWSDANKTPVFGIVQRNAETVTADGEIVPDRGTSKVVAYVVPSVQAKTVNAHMVRHVATSSVVYTDDAPIYRRLGKDGWEHHTIKHSEAVYVNGDVHTQAIEGFWSLVKRSLSGTHHSVSAKWLQGYLNEYVWRYNRRDNPRAMFELLLLLSAQPVAE
jgi:transposase-like protein